MIKHLLLQMKNTQALSKSFKSAKPVTLTEEKKKT